jgi:hypothetical protein
MLRLRAGRAPTPILPRPLALAAGRCRIWLGAAGRVGAEFAQAGPVRVREAPAAPANHRGMCDPRE